MNSSSQLLGLDPCAQHFGPGTRCNLSSTVASELFRVSARRRHVAGEVLFHAGDLGDVLYLVCDGRVALQSFGHEGRLITGSISGRGDIVGLHALFHPSHRHHVTAIARIVTTSRAIRRDDLLSVANRSPAVLLAFGRVLADHSVSVANRLPDLAWRRADMRVRVCLGDLFARFAPPGPDGRLVMEITQEEVADLAGVARPTASSVIGDAVRAGLLSTARRRLTILDHDRFLAWVRGE